MRKVYLLTGLCLMLAVMAAGIARAAEEVTLKGTVMCAKCSLKKADAKDGQDVLVTKDADGSVTGQYYIVKNDETKKFGHTCQGTAEATVTGTVSEQDGKKWIAPSKMTKGS